MSPEPEPDVDELELPAYPDDGASLVETLDWHLNRYRWYGHKIAEAEAQRDRMIERYQLWCERTTEPWRRKMVESEGFVTFAHLHAIESNPKHPKVLHLPSGVVRSVAPRASVVVEDPDAFKEWVTGRDDVERLARWRCEPIKDALKKVLLDGEMVDGVRLEEGERKVTITTEEW